MSAHVAGALALLITGWGAVITRQDYRQGVSRFSLSGGINMFTFRRDAGPAFFWASSVANVVLIGVVLIGGVAALMLPMRS